MDIAASAHAAALWAGLHIFLLLVLSVLVTRQRRKHHVSLGDGGVPALEQAIRAFGNASEYVPPALIGLAILALAGAPPLLIHPIGLVLFVGRVMHAVGISRSGGATLPRALGTLATWIAYVAVGAALLFYAIP
ncbi:MAPEG family protein [Phenylobacterium sp. J426]|uniref:MAPEG family protein n=1 Tax=Phenylobacterium sp. J426 TaxID=2898439 RepID=UPI002151EB62|nr:MAPEG family protein [Phenylobacterium sp. J426]MCR5873357.1 MAPEG family protein [Phenylobacterium sp. J426]